MTAFFTYIGMLTCLIAISGVAARLTLGSNWLKRLGLSIFLGTKLKTACSDVFKEFREKKVTNESLSNLSSALIERAVGVILFGLIAGIFPFALFIQQNFIMQEQLALAKNQEQRINRRLLRSGVDRAISDLQLFRLEKDNFFRMRELFEHGAESQINMENALEETLIKHRNVNTAISDILSTSLVYHSQRFRHAVADFYLVDNKLTISDSNKGSTEIGSAIDSMLVLLKEPHYSNKFPD